MDAFEAGAPGDVGPVEAGRRPRADLRPPLLPLLGLAAFAFWGLSELLPQALDALGWGDRLPALVQLGLVHVLALGGVIGLGILWTDIPPRELFPLRRIAPHHAAAVLAAMVGTSILGSEAANLLVHVFGGLPAPLPAPRAPVSETHLLATLAVVAGIVPWTEELLFRGLVLDDLRQRWRTGAACALSAALFAGFHLNPLQMPLAFVAGLVLAHWRVATGSLLPCLLGHACLNAVPFLLIAVAGEIPGYSIERGPTVRQPWLFNAFGALCLGLGVVGLRRARRAAGGLQ